MSGLYPYKKDPHEHPFAFVFYNAAGLGLNFDSSNALAKHIFADLKCGPPGSAGDPVVHYDALGTAGGPWRTGVWIPVDEPRMAVADPVVEKPVADMSDDELEKLKAQIAAVESGKKNSHSDETGEVG